MCYKTTTLKYTVDDIPLLSNIQPFLQIYDDTEKAVHAFLWYTIPIEWLITTTCSSLQSCVYQAEAVASTTKHPSALAGRAGWTTYIQPSKASVEAALHITTTTTTTSSDFSCSSSTSTTPLAFRNLMDNLWEKGKREKNISLCNNNNEHTYYHSTTKSTTPNIY